MTSLHAISDTTQLETPENTGSQPLSRVDTASAVRDGLQVSREARERAFSEADEDGHCDRSGFVLEEGQR